MSECEKKSFECYHAITAFTYILLYYIFKK